MVEVLEQLFVFIFSAAAEATEIEVHFWSTNMIHLLESERTTVVQVRNRQANRGISLEVSATPGYGRCLTLCEREHITMLLGPYSR